MKAILFDLDDTLLKNPMDNFLPAYFEALTRKVTHLVRPNDFMMHLMRATQAVIADTDPERTNEDVFWAVFGPAIEVPEDELMPILEDFYTNDFPKLHEYTERRPEARDLVQQAFHQGYDVVIATNPLFPRQAIQHRLAWAGVADCPYVLVTTYENMHFTKPHPAYYQEIADRIGHAPADCLMVGDDVENDIEPAAKLGMRTFWVTDDPACRQPADWQGALLDLKKYIGII